MVEHVGWTPSRISMLAEKVALYFKKEVVVRLVGQHMWGPTVPVGLPSFVFPFVATEANICGGFADLLEILAG